MKKLFKLTLFAAFLFSASAVFAQNAEREKGFEFYLKGEYQKAAEALQKSVESNADDGEAWRFLGMALARIGEEKAARKAFKASEKVKDADLNKLYDSPVKIISKQPARYTDEARQNFTTGTVKLFVEFRNDGKIGHIFTAVGLPFGLTQNCLDSARSIKFEPAIRNGKKVIVIKMVEYSFSVY
jgi:tetratricopeptide (TPR) repeat protein